MKKSVDLAVFYPHEDRAYQNMLVSENRASLIPLKLYNKLIPAKEKNINILDFGCGLGYVSALLSQHLKEGYHIYGCDYQEELLDEFWKRIVSRGLKNITPFFMPMRSRLLFPQWVPRMHHVVFSLSLSAVESIDTIFKSIGSILEPNGKLHVIDWLKNNQDKYLDSFFSERYRIEVTDVTGALNANGFEVIENYGGYSNVFALSARVSELHTGAN